MAWLLIDRAFYSDSGFFHDVKVDLCCFDALVSKQFLHGANVGAVFEEMCCEAVT